MPQFNYQNASKGPRCLFCTESHWSDQCQKYNNANARIQFVRLKNLCMGCLSNSHTKLQCQRPSTCFYCGGRHPRALCFKKFGQNLNNNFNNNSKWNEAQNKNKMNFSNNKNKNNGPGNRFDFGPNRPGLNNWKGTGANNVPIGIRRDGSPFNNGGFNSSKENNFNKEVRFSPKREVAPQQVNCQMIEPLNNDGLGKSLLMTVEITVFNPKKEEINLNVLAFLDPGSQRSFVTKEAANKLNLESIGSEEYYLTSFGNSMPKKYKCDLVKIGLRGENQKLTMVLNKLDFLVNPLPYYNVKEMLKDYEKIYVEKLLTTEYRQPDILLGMDIWHELHVQRMQVLPSGFTICQSRLGPIMSGLGQIEDEPQQLITGIYKAQTTQIYSVIQFTENKHHKNIEVDQENEENLVTFFGLSGVGMDDLTPRIKDQEVLENFRKNLTFIDGRYQIALPFNENIKFLPTNFYHAKIRLTNTIRKLQKLGLVDEYQKIITEQLENGMIEIIENPKESQGPVHYLPHRAVVRTDKTFTKVRIVMDASAKPPGQPALPSLNNCLYTGPLLLKQLVGILLRFRFLNKVILADIEKAFLQLGVRETDRDCTRFLWVANPKEIRPDQIPYTKCVVYRFCRVSFGLTVSPFLLNATIQEHLKLFDSPIARSIEENLYMDNIMIELKEGSTIGEVYKEAKNIFSAAGMRLREFFGATKKEFFDVPEEDLSPNLKETKIFGIKWNLEKETLSIEFPKIENFKTKRQLLSTIAKVYDPLGLISPALIPAKLLMQKIVEDNYKWDDRINDEYYQKLINVLQTWQENGQPIKIFFPRKLNFWDLKNHEFHCFTDASGVGFGCAIYVRAEAERAHLIFAKSLLKPARLQLTEATIPRLELQALTLGVKVLNFFAK
uniref:Uncharacterized protein n=1 Tax=Meloidogyne enterolobii TaxID=390850 RepID=A0A6V7WMU5_MELEN|nr:unnamed protein product [Meloidogyne enterolobii]